MKPEQLSPPEPLSPEEQRLLLALRALPASPLRERMWALVDDLVAFVSAPGCTEMQADGVPCASAQASCDECRKLTSLIEGLRNRLQGG